MTQAMTESEPVGPSLLLKAAELAERAAAAASGDWQAYFTVAGDPMIVPVEHPRPISRIADVSTGPDDYGGANCRLLGASGPQHWRAVAIALRGIAKDHSVARLSSNYCARCAVPIGECLSLAAVLPLARQVITSLQA